MQINSIALPPPPHRPSFQFGENRFDFGATFGGENKFGDKLVGETSVTLHWF